jgi:hypothetical protein
LYIYLPVEINYAHENIFTTIHQQHVKKD